MKKIQLGCIFYGAKNQAKTNLQQFEFFKIILKDFTVKKYDFNKGEDKKLLRDFKSHKIDVVIKNSYGRGNENTIESWLDFYGIPYLGSSAYATLVGSSKLLSKSLFKTINLPLAQDYLINWQIWKDQSPDLFKQINVVGFPAIVKDAAGTDSRGIFLVNNAEELKVIINKNLNKQKSFIVEKFITDAYECTCLTSGENDSVVAYEPVGCTKDGIILDAKSKDNMSFVIDFPAKLSKQMIFEIKKLSVQAHRILQCKDFARTDFLIKNNKIYILETDVHPGFREKSASTLSLLHENIDLNEFFLQLIKNIKINKK